MGEPIRGEDGVGIRNISMTQESRKYWCVFCNKDLSQIGGDVCKDDNCFSFGYLHIGVCIDCQGRYHTNPDYYFEVSAPYGRLKDFYYRDLVESERLRDKLKNEN